MLLVPVEVDSGVLEAQGRAGQNKPSNGRQRVLESETRRERDCFSIGENSERTEGVRQIPEREWRTFQRWLVLGDLKLEAGTENGCQPATVDYRYAY